IRAATVTGVQTCALPISACQWAPMSATQSQFGLSVDTHSNVSKHGAANPIAEGARVAFFLATRLAIGAFLLITSLFCLLTYIPRSEERRVGKESGFACVR